MATKCCVDCGVGLKDHRSFRCRRCGAIHSHADKPKRPVNVDDRHRAVVDAFRWSPTVGGKYLSGKPIAGHKSVYLHRFVWFLEYGEWPAKHLDHINRDSHDNRIENLRLATVTLNMRNRTPRKGTKYPPGVRHRPEMKGRPFRAMICRRGRSQYLGYFATVDEATACYENARQIIEEFEALESLN